jgi:hypothetical protein
MNWRVLVAVMAISIMLSACATIIRGTEQQVSVNTNPIGAKVDFSNGQSCLTPCSITTRRDQALQLNLSKDGCATQTATMIPTLAGGGVILGGIIDYGTGAVYDLQPNPLTITMACQTASQAGNFSPAMTPAVAMPRTPIPPNLGIIGGTVVRGQTGPGTYLADPYGAWVDNVMPRSPAAQAGIRQGDIIRSYNGHRVSGIEELGAYVTETIPGSAVTLGVFRNRQMIEVLVDLPF